MKLVHAAAAAALLAGATPAAAQPAQGQDNAPTCAAQQPKKKIGFALGGLISAAKRAGVGDMLTGRAGNMLGSGKGSQIFGAVAGTALNAAENGRVDPSSLAGAAGSGRAGQIAGAVTGMVAEAAAGASAGCGAN
jgi:hypothetical protein